MQNQKLKIQYSYYMQTENPGVTPITSKKIFETLINTQEVIQECSIIF